LFQAVTNHQLTWTLPSLEEKILVLHTAQAMGRVVATMNYQGKGDDKSRDMV
jgi:hypothetical protein